MCKRGPAGGKAWLPPVAYDLEPSTPPDNPLAGKSERLRTPSEMPGLRKRMKPRAFIDLRASSLSPDILQPFSVIPHSMRNPAFFH